MGVKMVRPRVATVTTQQGGTVATKRVRGRKAQFVRQQVAVRDGFACRECGRLALSGDADHVVPLHVGGGDHLENMQWLCKDCHRSKSEGEQKARGGGGVNIPDPW